MALTFSLNVSNRSGLDYLQGMLDRSENLRPVLAEIGEDMAESTKRRFTTTQAPDGTPWAPNSATTIERYSHSDLFARKKDGTLKKKDQAKIARKKPLAGESGALASKINYQLQGDNAVSIGSPMVYAAMQQFGGKKSDFPYL